MISKYIAKPFKFSWMRSEKSQVSENSATALFFTILGVKYTIFETLLQTWFVLEHQELFSGSFNYVPLAASKYVSLRNDFKLTFKHQVPCSTAKATACEA